ncbi:MAG: VCBS repeat-containing protein, partial [Deltaproteobacteria bacterium]|nr:VCBS repeat-containing protein [Deltaproteobacteria bacterium]
MIRRSSVRRLARAAALVFLAASPAAARGVDPTRLSLPRGPGSVEGLGLRDVATGLPGGGLALELPIRVPPAAGGLGPRLSLAYDSGRGLTELGIGWALGGLPSVRVRTADGLPRFDGTDRFEVVGIGATTPLVEVSPGRFRPEVEDGTFLRADRSDDGERWEVRTREGRILRFGGPGAREAEGVRVAAHLLAEEVDRLGHRVRYEWDLAEGHALLTRVVWNERVPERRNEVVLVHGPRTDRHRRWSQGITETLSRRLDRIDVRQGGATVRSYRLEYSAGPHPALAAVTELGSDGVTALQPVRLEYTPADLTPGRAEEIAVADAPARLADDPDAALLDADGDGLPDIVVLRAGDAIVYPNLDGRRFGAPRALGLEGSPSASLSSQGAVLADLDADGAVDLLVGAGDGSLRAFPATDLARGGASGLLDAPPALASLLPALRFGDLDGDRRADAVLTVAGGLSVAWNRGGTAFDELQPIGAVDPAEVLDLTDGSTSLCDVNGDRVLDLCKLRSGTLTYFLGLGHGRFGERSEGQGVPEFAREAPFVLADLDGDGWVDLVRADVQQVTVALAVGEGRFGAPLEVTPVPERTAGVTFELADMNASGTTDLVWVDRNAPGGVALRYLELFPAGRGRLLSRLDGGTGRVQRFEWEPAASATARAREAGEPPGPRQNLALPVLRRVTTDLSLGEPPRVVELEVGGGAWDPVERTFAGFARVTTTARGATPRTTLITRREHDLGLGDRALRGVLVSEELADGVGASFERKRVEHRVSELARGSSGGSVRRAVPVRETVEHVEGGAAPPRVVVTEWEEDHFGNRTLEHRLGDESPGDEVRIRRTFAVDEEGWLLDRVATEEHLDDAGRRASMSRKYYDGADFLGLPLGQVERGVLAREEAWVGPDLDDFERVLGTRSDADGNPVETRDARGGGRRFEWDPDGVSLRAEWVKVAAERALRHGFDVDPRSGAVLASTPPDGNTTTYRYDALGRLTAEHRPGDPADAPSVTYQHDVAAPLSRLTTRRRRHPGEPRVDVEEAWFDGAGKRRATRVLDGEATALRDVALYD